MSDRMTQERLEEIRGRARAATAGPWTTTTPPKDEDGWQMGCVIAQTAASRSNRVFASPPGGSFPASDQAFIAAARQDIPDLLAEVAALTKDLDIATSAVSELEGTVNELEEQRADARYAGRTELESAPWSAIDHDGPGDVPSDIVEAVRQIVTERGAATARADALAVWAERARKVLGRYTYSWEYTRFRCHECLAAHPNDWRHIVHAPACILADPPAAVPDEPFQARARKWSVACFSEEIADDKVERRHRLLEEFLELDQAAGGTPSEAHQIVDYVHGRPVGEFNQEVGGVMVTLALLCAAHGVDLVAAGETELARVWTQIEAIRAKQAAKPKHSPLPMHVAAVPDDRAALLRVWEAAARLIADDSDEDAGADFEPLRAALADPSLPKES